MFSSFPSLPNPFTVPRFLRPSSKSQNTLTIPPITPHEIETNPDKRARTLKHLLKLNHAQHSVIYHQLHYHNHLPHILGSAYVLNASPNHLNAIYDSDSKSLEPWTPSPNEISEDDWKEYLGDRQYQRAYLDFFEDRLVESGYDWKGVIWKYLFEERDGLGNNLVAGLGHCIIHLGYAFELQSRELAMEALTLTTCFHDSLGKYLIDPAYTIQLPPNSGPAKPSSSTLSILRNIRADPRLERIPHHHGAIGMAELFKKYENVVLEHWNSWAFDYPGSKLDDVFEEAQRTPIALLVGSKYPPTKKDSKEYDFFLVHLLTTSHALRILLPIVAELARERGAGGKRQRGPREWQIVLLRQWWLFFVAVYIMQGRPEIDESRFTGQQEEEGKERGNSGEWSESNDEEAAQKGWKRVVKEAVEGEWSLDSHFVKAVRAIKVAGETWAKDEEGERWYLDAARVLVKEFNGWGGFGTRAEKDAEHLGGHE